MTLVFGTLAWVRVPHGADEEETSASALHPARLLEQLELRTYDWRVAELGRTSEPSRDVVMAAVDDETLARASASRQPGLASQPWPREVMGGIVNELAQQGASLVLVDFLFSYLSPIACTTNLPQAYGLDGPELSDDLSFRALLDKVPGKSLLAFTRQLQERSFLASELVQHLTLVDQRDAREATFEPLRQVLATRRMAFSIPDGPRYQVWAGVDSKDDAQNLLSTLASTRASEPVLRPRTSSETAYQVTPTDLLVALSEVEVEGIDPLDLPVIPAVDHPASPLLGDKSGFGSVIATADVDGIVRRFPHLHAWESRGKVHVLPSMPLVAAMRLAGTRKLVWRDGRLHVGDRYSFPMDAQGYSLIRWDAPESDESRGSLASFVPVWRIVQDVSARLEGLPVRHPDTFKDRVVVLTNTSSSGRDFKPTPIGEETPGGAVLGQALVNILRSQGVERVHPKWDLLAVAAMALLGSLLALSLSGALRTGRGAVIYLAGLAVALGAWVGVARYLFVDHGQWVAMAAPALGMTCSFLMTTVYGTRSERRVREFIFSVLGQSVSPEVARRVARDFSLIRPERREVTVYFADIEGFTRISEQLEPDELIHLLEEYFAETTRLVRGTGGHLDKFIGDALMALWNAPTPNPRHASLACESALRMREELLKHQPEWEKRFGVKLVARAGINTGEAVVGHVGSDLQAAYTAIGDSVNMASRLEGANKTYGTFILAGAATVERASEDFVFREVDRVQVKGRDVPTRIFELISRKGEADPRIELLGEYDAALALYHEGRLAEAGDRFARLATQFDDPVSAVYVARCRQDSPLSLERERGRG